MGGRQVTVEAEETEEEQPDVLAQVLSLEVRGADATLSLRWTVDSIRRPSVCLHITSPVPWSLRRIF